MKILVILNLALWFCAIGCYALPKALDAEHENGIAITEQRNAENIDDIDDDAIYLASEQYQTAKHANQFIAKAYGRD